MRKFYPTKMETYEPSPCYIRLFGGIRRSTPSYAQGFRGLSFLHSYMDKSRGLLRRRIKERIRECAFFTVIGLGVLALAGGVREARADFEAQPICIDPEPQMLPRISAESTDANEIIVVWMDATGGYPNSKVYMWDSNGISPVSENSYRQIYPDVSNNYVVWEDYRKVNPYLLSHTICIKNIKDPNSEQQIYGTKREEYLYDFYESRPAISGSNVVWKGRILDDINKKAYDGIFMWDPVNKRKLIYTNPDPNTHRSFPDISGNKIVWEEDVNGSDDIYMWDPVNGIKVICDNPADQMRPAISKDVVVWVDNRGVHKNNDIYMWDPVNGERAVCTNRSHQSNPTVFVDTIVKVVWEDYRNDVVHVPEAEGNPDIYMWDPVNGERAVCTNPVKPPYPIPPQVHPDISGNYIVWQDGRNGKFYYLGGNWDIYMAKIPEKTLKADFDNDGIVSFKDFAKFAEQWLAREQWFASELSNE